MAPPQALSEVLVGREDADLRNLRTELRGTGGERVVGLEFAHRPHRHPQGSHRFFRRVELGEQLRRDAFLGLVSVEEIVAEAADGIVEGDRDVAHGLAFVVEEREHRRGERDGRFLVAAVRSAMRRPLREVGAEELVGAVHQVQPHGRNSNAI